MSKLTQEQIRDAREILNKAAWRDIDALPERLAEVLQYAPVEQPAQSGTSAPAGKSAVNLADAPLGTKAHATGGGYWIKVEHGWKWFCGSTFRLPGGDWDGKLEYPAPAEQPAQAGASEVMDYERCLHCGNPISEGRLGWTHEDSDQMSCEFAEPSGTPDAPQDRPQAPMPDPQPVPLVERMLVAFSQHRHKARQIDGMTAALNVALDATEKEIQDEGDRISWQGFGAETTFAKAVRARLSAPVRDPAKRVTVTFYDAEPTPYWQVSLDGKHIGPRFPVTGYQVDAERYAAGLRAELADQARAAGGGKK